MYLQKRKRTNRELKLFELIFEKANFEFVKSASKTRHVGAPTGLKWTYNAIDLVEVAYAVIATRAVNYGDIDIKELVKKLSEIFNIPIKNPYHLFAAIKARTAKDRALFLKKLENNLVGFIEKTEGL